MPEISMAVMAVGLTSAWFIAELVRTVRAFISSPHFVRPSARPPKHMDRKGVTKLRPEVPIVAYYLDSQLIGRVNDAGQNA